MDKLQPQRIGNYNYLRAKIVGQHMAVARRPRKDVVVSVDKELCKLSRGLLNKTVRNQSYKIIKANLGIINDVIEYVEISSRLGFRIRVDKNHFREFFAWAVGPESDKPSFETNAVNIGGTLYTTYKTDEKGNRIPD